MKRNLLVVCLMMCLIIPAIAQELKIEPIWEFLNTSSNSPIPIMKPYPADGPIDDAFDALLWGETPNESFVGLKRYDETRLLLGIRENGIQESKADHDAALAAAYPDRSLIWIDAATGKPLGVALVVGLHPVELDADFLAAGGTTNDYYFAFGVSEDGVIITGYKNKLLRYDPDGNGGFTGPKVVYTIPKQGDYWNSWRWEDIEVWGAGTSMEVIGGGKTWRPYQGYRHFTTKADGTLEFKYYIGNEFADDANGGLSKPIIHGNSDLVYYPTERVVYGNRYPGGDGGTGHIFNRWFLPNDADVAIDPIDPHQTVGYVKDLADFWAPERPLLEADPANPDLPVVPRGEGYRIDFCTDFDSANGLSYVVAYAAPSWSSMSAYEGVYAPGWLAIHDASGQNFIDGGIISSLKIDTNESTEIAYSDGSSEWHGTLGEIDVNVPAKAEANACEILWSGAIYGYGRYHIGNIGEEPVSVVEWSLF